MYITTFKEKRGHELESEKGGVYERVCREGRDGESLCNYIIIPRIKEIKKRSKLCGKPKLSA